MRGACVKCLRSPRNAWLSSFLSARQIAQKLAFSSFSHQKRIAIPMTRGRDEKFILLLTSSLVLGNPISLGPHRQTYYFYMHPPPYHHCSLPIFFFFGLSAVVFFFVIEMVKSVSHPLFPIKRKSRGSPFYQPWMISWIAPKINENLDRNPLYDKKATALR